MNNTFFFFIIALAILVLSIVSICVAPIINGFLKFGGTKNCKFLSDVYDYEKSLDNNLDESAKKIFDERHKKKINACKRRKAMHSLEYASLTCDIVLGGICAILGLLHYLEIGLNIQSKTGLLGIITGTIGFILTIIYVGFSGYIFTNDKTQIKKYFPNGASYKWNGMKYVHPYDENEEKDHPDIIYATYSELGQKQYDYDSDFYKSFKQNSHQYTDCHTIQINSQETDIPSTQPTYQNSEGRSMYCDYLWERYYDTYIGNGNKYLYERWVTTLILSVFIFICCIGLILFGFFLFKNSNSDNIQIASSANQVLNKE